MPLTRSAGMETDAQELVTPSAESPPTIAAPRFNLSQEELMAPVLQFQNSLRRFPRGGTFTTCTARYNGPRGNNELDRFIAAIQIFKRAEQITDEDAVKGLAILLTDRAADWWEVERAQGEVTWNEAISKLQKAFDVRKPAYLIYQDITRITQDKHVSTSVFVNEKRKILSKLKFNNIDEIQLDLVYGQLSEKIKDSVPRESISNLTELVEKANWIEGRWAEKEADAAHTTQLRPERRHRSPSQFEKWPKSYCDTCKRTGHTTEECRNRPNMIEGPKFVCYGCGKANNKA